MTETGSGADGRLGSQFGPYRLDALLGRGGMGEVYRAYDTQRDREVALKLLSQRAVDDGTFAERFRRECQTVARLGEPHIIPIHDFGEIDGTLYLDMRLVEGQTLRGLLEQSGPLPADEAVAVAEQVAQALDAAHAAGLVHRDVKPENILVTANRFAYLVDFGLVHQAADVHLTRTGTAIGSMAYMAPEQFDDAPVSPASDVYALAAVLFQMLTGRTPHPGESVSSIVRAVVLGDVPPPSSLNPEVPAALDPVLARGLAKDPQQRFASAGELAAAARSALTWAAPAGPTVPFATGAGGPAYEPTTVGRPAISQPLGYGSGPVPPSGPVYPGGYPPAAPPPEPKGNGTQWVLVGLIALLVLALAGLGIYYFGFRDSGSDQKTAAGPSSTTTITSTITPTSSTPAPPPPGSSPCSTYEGVGTSVTTCPFAAAVRQAYAAAGPWGQSRTVTAVSPVTGSSYSMNCGPSGEIVICRGGNDAEVHLY